jgi:hypothetical protein
MGEQSEVLLDVLRYAAVVLSPIAAGFTVFFMLRMVSNAKPGVPLRGRQTLWNPANVVVRPSLLTDQGRVYRRRFIVSAICFLLPFVLMLIASAVTGNLE